MIDLSIRRPVAISMAYLCVALLGVGAWRNIPIELLPDEQLPHLTVSARMTGASPEVTEAFLTAPLESAVEQVRGVAKVTSTSALSFGAGQATIQIGFARETDMNFARLELSERLAALDQQLPRSVYGLRVSTAVPEEFRQQSRSFLQYTVTGPYTLEALRTHLDQVIAPELRQVDGVADVTAYGGRNRLLEIDLDESKILALGLAAAIVSQRISRLEDVRNAGAIVRGGLERTVAIRQTALSPADFEGLAVLTNRGRVVHLRDVATVHNTFEDAQNYYRIDGQPAVSFTVLREPRTNAVAVADKVKARLAGLMPLHPPGVRLILDNDESAAIRAQLSDLRFRSYVSAAVIFVVLLVFLRSFRSAGIVFATIGFSVLITLNLLYFGGLTLNVLTLMGLAMGFGLIVDDAIVVLENIYRKRREGASAEQAARDGAREVTLAVIASTLTTVIVFIPFLYLQGNLRAYYVPLALVVGMGLLASLVVAFSFIPAVASKLLVFGVRGVTVRAGAGPPVRPLYVRFYEGMLGVTLRFPWLTVGTVALMLFGSFRVFDKYVTRGVVWRSWWGNDTYIGIDIRLPQGEELARTDELARFFEARLKETPQVARFVTNVQPQYASIRVSFPDSLANTGIPIAIKEQLGAFIYQFGGAAMGVYGYGQGFGTGGGGSSPTYNIAILGYNYQTVQAIAEDLGRRLKRFSRIAEVDVNSGGRFDRDRVTELALTIDRRRLALHGLTARDVVSRVQAAAGGAVGGAIVHMGGEELRYSVKLASHDTMDVQALTNLILPAPGGEGVRLGDVATLAPRDVLSEIVRENQQYRRSVSYEFRGPAKLGDRVRDAVVAATNLPDGYKIVSQDMFRWSPEEEKQIGGVLAISLVLIYLVTAALFESLRQPLCILLTVPMALIGVFLIFFYANASFTREAYIGVIMMGGIVVKNAILLIDRVNQLRRRHGVPLEQAIRRGTIERVRPILMTSACTVFGLLPLVLFSEAADANIWNALGYALIGGLTSSTVLVLSVTPALYLLFERKWQWPWKRAPVVLPA